MLLPSTYVNKRYKKSSHAGDNYGGVNCIPSGVFPILGMPIRHTGFSGGKGAKSLLPKKAVCQKATVIKLAVC